MKYLLKTTLIAAPALFALTACDAPPAEDPALENDNEMIVPPVEEPLDTTPMGDAPVDGNLTGGEAPVANPMDPAYNAETDTPPMDEEAATDTTEETTTTE
jgi:hypothetical protein